MSFAKNVVAKINSRKIMRKAKSRIEEIYTMVVKKFLDIPLLKRHRHILIPHYREGSPQTCGFKDKGELGAGKILTK